MFKARLAACALACFVAGHMGAAILQAKAGDDMVWVAGGSFLMGSSSQFAQPNEQPVFRAIRAA